MVTPSGDTDASTRAQLAEHPELEDAWIECLQVSRHNLDVGHGLL